MGSRQRLFSRPVVPILVFFMAGIAAGSQYPGWGAFMIPAAAVCGLASLGRLRGEKPACLPVAGLFLVIGYLSVQPWESPRFPDRHIVYHADSGSCSVTGLVGSSPVVFGDRIQFVLKTRLLERGMERLPTCGWMRVTVRAQSPDIRMGDTVRLTGRIRSIRSFRNPGGFDYRRYMAYQGIRVSMYVSAKGLALVERKEKKDFGWWMERKRQEVSALIRQTGSPQSRAVLAALLIGDRSAISPQTREAFNRAGLGHLLAISGLHIGTIAAAAFFFFSWAFSRIPALLWAAWTRKSAAILTLFPVVFYGMLAGMSPSTQRAVIMVGVFLLAFLAEREHDPVNTLAAAALVILAIHPPSLFSASFQLSFSAVFAIVYGMSRLSPGRWEERSLGKRLFDFLRVTLLAVFGTLPLVMFYFNQVSVAGIVANFILVPPVGFAVIPLGLMSVFIYPLSHSAALGLMEASAAVLGQSLSLVGFISDLPYAAIKTVTPCWAEMVCYYLLAWGLLQVAGKGDGLGRVESRRVAAGAILVSLLMGGADGFYWIQTRLRHPDLRVTILDVGQGSAALVEFPQGPCMLIDGGGFSDPRAFDVGEKVVAPFLWRNKIRTIDTVVLSHPDSDHLNGLLFIARHFRIGEVWAAGDPWESHSYGRFVETLQQRNIPLPSFPEIPRVREIHGAKVELLYPPADFQRRKETESWRNWNNCSLAVRVTLGSRSFLFPGDIMADAEKELVGMYGADLKSGVLVAPHHGSHTSSTPEFLREVNPQVVVVSSGRKSGKSDRAVLERYGQHNCRIYRTYDDGAVQMSTDGAGLWIQNADGNGRLRSEAWK